jgi:hypothetical protein
MDQADSVLSTPPINTSADTPPERPAESAGALYVKTPVTPPRKSFRLSGESAEARDEIDRLIRFLDSTENHMAIDCEPEDEGDDAEDEPSLGRLEVTTKYDFIGRGPWSRDAFNQDRHQGDTPGDDLEADDCDDEPALGSIERAEWTDQERWAYSGTKDLEDEHDGAELSGDEPSLGAFEGHDNQRVAWWVTSMMDYELDHSESGIGDYDGLAEQVGSQDWQQAGMA